MKQLLITLTLYLSSINANGQAVADTAAVSIRKYVTKVTIGNAKKLERDSTYLLSNVAFEADRHEFRPGCDGDVYLLYQKLIDNPALKIEIQGHVCCIHDAPDALDVGTNEPTLSLNRAKEIYNCLIGRGVDPARVKYTGLGRSKPIVEHEITNEEAALNRRVEIKILEN